MKPQLLPPRPSPSTVICDACRAVFDRLALPLYYAYGARRTPIFDRAHACLLRSFSSPVPGTMTPAVWKAGWVLALEIETLKRTGGTNCIAARHPNKGTTAALCIDSSRWKQKRARTVTR